MPSGQRRARIQLATGVSTSGNTSTRPMAVQEAAAICREFGVPYGSPQANAENMSERVRDGFQSLMPAPGRDLGGLQLGQSLAGRNV